MEKKKCNGSIEVYSRVTGFMRPVKAWNPGKREEFKERKTYDVKEDKDGRHSKS